jgi:hypothetical protein
MGRGERAMQRSCPLVSVASVSPRFVACMVVSSVIATSFARREHLSAPGWNRVFWFRALNEEPLGSMGFCACSGRMRARSSSSHSVGMSGIDA